MTGHEVIQDGDKCETCPERWKTGSEGWHGRQDKLGGTVIRTTIWCPKCWLRDELNEDP